MVEALQQSNARMPSITIRSAKALAVMTSHPPKIKARLAFPVSTHPLPHAEVTRSPIRWAGSKKKLLPHLLKLAPKKYRRYVEPFCGSLCLFVALKPKVAVLGDINVELIHFYRMIRWRPNNVAMLAHAVDTNEATYYKMRSLMPETLSAEQRAARFLYLNRFCFNGVYRTNRAGLFNVARGQHTGEIPSIGELAAFGRLLRRATLFDADFSDLLESASKDDFVYLDPPYAGRDVRDRGEYGVGAFKTDDIVRLADQLTALDKRGSKVLLSYADIPEIRDHFRHWNIDTIEVDRNVSGFSRGRSRVSELLIRNYE